MREEKWCPADAISLCGSEEHLVTSRTLDGETSFDSPLHLQSQKHDAVMSSFVESSSNSLLFDVGDRVYYTGGHPGPPYGTPGEVKKILTASDGFRRNIGMDKRFDLIYIYLYIYMTFLYGGFLVEEEKKLSFSIVFYIF